MGAFIGSVLTAAGAIFVARRQDSAETRRLQQQIEGNRQNLEEQDRRRAKGLARAAARIVYRSLLDHKIKVLHFKMTLEKEPSPELVVQHILAFARQERLKPSPELDNPSLNDQLSGSAIVGIAGYQTALETLSSALSIFQSTYEESDSRYHDDSVVLRNRENFLFEVRGLLVFVETLRLLLVALTEFPHDPWLTDEAFRKHAEGNFSPQKPTT